LDWITGPEQIGSFPVPEGLKFGATAFGNYTHLATADLLQNLCPNANFAFSAQPGQTGVDVEVLGQTSIEADGEIMPLTPSGEASFSRQIQNWNLSAPVRAITYDARGHVYLGFR
jgi:hypothetical protein